MASNSRGHRIPRHRETDSDSIESSPGNTAGSDGRHVQPESRKLRRDGERAEDKA